MVANHLDSLENKEPIFMLSSRILMSCSEVLGGLMSYAW